MHAIADCVKAMRDAGIPVTLLEINEEALQRGKEIIAKKAINIVEKRAFEEPINLIIDSGSTCYYFAKE